MTCLLAGYSDDKRDYAETCITRIQSPSCAVDARSAGGDHIHTDFELFTKANRRVKVKLVSAGLELCAAKIAELGLIGGPDCIARILDCPESIEILARGHPVPIGGALADQCATIIAPTSLDAHGRFWQGIEGSPAG